MRIFNNRLIVLIWLLPLCLPAQTSIRVQPGAAVQLQMQMRQPGVDVESPVTATAIFDPPTVHVGQKAYYRVQLSATEASIQWPDTVSAPAELKFGRDVRGQRMQPMGGTVRAFTGFTYEVIAAKTGHFTVSNFSVAVNGQPVDIPAASLNVVPDNVTVEAGRRILLQSSKTNLFLGEPFRLSVILPAQSNQVVPLSEIQINGDGFIPDKTTVQNFGEPLNLNGPDQPPTSAFVCEMTVTPMATGPLTISAQGFTSALFALNGPISIRGPVQFAGGTPDYALMMSDEMAFAIQPLPMEGRLPGFTGSIGQFICNPPMLSTNRLQVGEPVHLKLSVNGLGNLTRRVPPLVPRSRDWQIIADDPPALGFTLIPMTDDVEATPEIPWCYFDPETGKYVDLTVPSLPVTVTGQGLPVQLEATDQTEAGAPAKLSDLAVAPGEAVGSLKPLQMQGWFIGLELLPALGFFALVCWDRHRRFLEAHPEVVRCRRARKALRQEKRRWRRAIATGDAAGFVQSAAQAMRIASAPHFPANPQALVCADVLAQLDGADQAGCVGDTVRKIFTVADAQFALAPQTSVDLLSLEPEVDMVLMKLEEKL